MKTQSKPKRWPTKVWEDPDPDVEMTDEERKEFFGDGSPDTRTDEERRKDLESWKLD
ncbi:MAG: hypothetical protein IJG84_18585 [Kiritimatiellae bacterium]|nr:hypothetical protein [Kiritimatiellia bacterium]